MKLMSSSFSNNGKIPVEFAFCAPDPKTHVTLSKNRNPEFSWSDAPTGTKTFALICHDYDVPSKGDDVNKEGRTIPATLPRIDFYHWVLVDLPASANAIKAGEFSDGVTPRQGSQFIGNQSMRALRRHRARQRFGQLHQRDAVRRIQSKALHQSKRESLIGRMRTRVGSKFDGALTDADARGIVEFRQLDQFVHQCGLGL